MGRGKSRSWPKSEGRTDTAFLESVCPNIPQNEKPKLENARRMRGIYFIDLEAEEYKETTKNARKKLEVQMKAAMPCKKKNTSYSPFAGNCSKAWLEHPTRFQKQSTLV